MSANTSKNSLIIASSNDEASDSDSTDYEPETKKCKVENLSQDIDTNVLNTSSLIAVPIRAATTVAVVSYAGPANVIDSRGIDRIASSGSSSGGLDSLLTVGDLVQQTLEASLAQGPISARRTSPMMSQGLFSQLSDLDMTPPVRLSNSSRSTSPPAIPAVPAGDFHTIAREVVIRDGNGSRSGLHSRRNSYRGGSGRQGRRRYTQSSTPENDNEVNSNESRSSSSCSSSEYFTDDIDPLEIPSDEYLSPPYPTRQRRNAIFLRRDPPPTTAAQNEDDQYYHNELEVASVLDMNENPIENASSTSGVDDEVLRRTHSPVEPPPPETDNNFADSENLKSDSDSEPTQQPESNNATDQKASDSEISEKDGGLCCQCHAQKPEPFFRYCLRCFKLRRTWLPARPASRRLKKRKNHLRNSNASSLNTSINSRTRSSDSSGEDVVDGGPPKSQQSQESADLVPDNESPASSSGQILRSLPSSQSIDMNEGFLIDDNNPAANRLTPDSQPGNLTLMELFAQPESRIVRTSRPSTATDLDSQSQSQSQSGSSSSQSQGSLFSQNSQNSIGTFGSTQSSSPCSQPLLTSSPVPKSTSTDMVSSLSSQCSICYVRDKNAAFVHNKIAHLYCCYTCADKILKRDGKCPICREKVLRVVKIISV